MEVSKRRRRRLLNRKPILIDLLDVFIEELWMMKALAQQGVDRTRSRVKELKASQSRFKELEAPRPRLQERPSYVA